MPADVTLALSGTQHSLLKDFLFPGDGKEAAAILLCGRRDGDRQHRLVVQEVHGIPYNVCSKRTPVSVTWPPDYTAPLLDRAADKGLSVVKVHSHPSGFAAFSPTDDSGDAKLLPMIRGWVEAPVLHGSAVMLPNGQMFGRVLDAGNQFRSISCIAVAGDDLQFWYGDAGGAATPSFVASHAQIFDVGTIERLRRLTVVVVGCSGTGSPVIEQLVRLGVGTIIIVDDDCMEERNVNRILNSTMADARANRPKVEVLEEEIHRLGLGTRVIAIKKNLWTREAVLAVAQSDVIFGCMDTVDGRYLLNAIASYYSIPYFDIGVRIVATRDGADKGRIREVCGTVHYMQPGRSSLMSRGLFSMQQVAAAILRRNDPEAHRRQVEDGYIAGVVPHRPAVISVNMFAASLAVNEFLARLHPYREEPNGNFAENTFSLASMDLFCEPDEGMCEILGSKVGLGDVEPLLGTMELVKRGQS